MLEFLAMTESVKPINPVDLVYQAIFIEQKENPDCPLAQEMFSLLIKHQNGDPRALDLAVEMARDTLKPQKNFIQEVLKHFPKFRPS